MALSHELISQFAKIVKDNKKQSAESTVYGTIIADGNGNKYVKLDGSDQLTPLTDNERPSADSTTASANDGERVSVLIKNHTATITGNVSSPSVRSDDFKNLDDQVTDIKKFDIVIAERVQANEGYIKNLQADKASIGDLTAATARITELESTKASIEELNAAKAEITDLKTTKLDAKVANATYATIEKLNATNAEIQSLGTKYANIDFSNIGMAAVEKLFADSGIISDLVVSEGHITGKLVGVTIVGDLIEGNTVKADKLVVLGEDGLYYKLNTNGVTTTAEQTEYNSLNGSIITAKTVTAEKVNVDDLVAFDATIGGFNISDRSIYSDVKASIDNTTRGVYLDTDGQVSFGDANNYIRYFKGPDGKYQLEISANSISMKSGNDSVNLDTTISNLKNEISTAQSSADKGISDANNDISTLSKIISKYFTFDGDGLTIGSSNSSVKLALDNNQIKFTQDGNTESYWTPDDFIIGNIKVEVSKRAQFGNFAFIPRSDGSLMFLKVGN